MKKKTIFISLFAALMATTGCKDDTNLQYEFIPANLNPDKTSITFNANANTETIMLNAAPGSSWFVRSEGDVSITLRATDRIVISVGVNKAVNDNDQLVAKTSKILLFEYAADGSVAAKGTINITQQYYRQAGSTGTTDWDNGNPPAYAWTWEGKGANGQADVVTVAGLQNNDYTYEVVGSAKGSVAAKSEGADAARALKLSAQENANKKVLKGFLFITDKDGKNILTARPLTVEAKP